MKKVIYNINNDKYGIKLGKMLFFVSRVKKIKKGEEDNWYLTKDGNPETRINIQEYIDGHRGLFSVALDLEKGKIELA